MKELLLLVMLGAVVFLWLDDKSQRSAIEQTQAEVDRLTSEREQLAQQLAGRGGTPGWFQKRLQEPSGLTIGKLGDKTSR